MAAACSCLSGFGANTPKVGTDARGFRTHAVETEHRLAPFDGGHLRTHSVDLPGSTCRAPACAVW